MDKAIKTFSASCDKVNIDKELALRFLRVRKEVDDETNAILENCLDEFEKAVQYKASYRYYDIKVEDDKVAFEDDFTLKSEKLSKNLRGCSGAFVFVATTSIGVDRLVNKYMNLQLSRAVILDSIGSAAVESFCDYLCKTIQDENGLNFRPRFSPGYGDLNISCQGCVLSACDASRKIGVTLSSNHMMVPKKTVSAIAGVRPKDEVCKSASRCENCENTNCLYRE
ncbi:MAG: hypothetical protein IJ015_03750 [Ruminococcus sp.]|nr:hypothetical protein [Ruminococcus sp.]